MRDFNYNPDEKIVFPYLLNGALVIKVIHDSLCYWMTPVFNNFYITVI